MTQVCSKSTVYHYFLNRNDDQVASMLEKGLRPLSDFPDSPRWQQIQQHVPGMFEKLYHDFAEPVLKKPYSNSGVFVTPIDFRRIPGSLLGKKARFAIPVERLDPAWTALMYELDGERRRLAFTAENLAETAAVWTVDLVNEWFAKDQTKIFYYVPQVMCYQPGGIPVYEDDLEEALAS